MKSKLDIRGQLKVRSADGEDALDITHVYIDSWNLGFGKLMPQRSVTAELVQRW